MRAFQVREILALLRICAWNARINEIMSTEMGPDVVIFTLLKPVFTKPNEKKNNL